MTDLNQRLRAYVITSFYVRPGHRFDETTSILAQGIIDSRGVLELVAFVESEFGIAVSDEELVPANFDSIAALAQFIARKRGGEIVVG